MTDYDGKNVFKNNCKKFKAEKTLTITNIYDKKKSKFY
jgi:hypothetical protein